MPNHCKSYLNFHLQWFRKSKKFYENLKFPKISFLNLITVNILKKSDYWLNIQPVSVSVSRRAHNFYQTWGPHFRWALYVHSLFNPSSGVSPASDGQQDLRRKWNSVSLSLGPSREIIQPFGLGGPVPLWAVWFGLPLQTCQHATFYTVILINGYETNQNLDMKKGF